MCGAHIVRSVDQLAFYILVVIPCWLGVAFNVSTFCRVSGYLRATVRLADDILSHESTRVACTVRARFTP